MKKILHFIGGEKCPALAGEWINSFGPATGEVIAHIARGKSGDVDLAVKAAKAALPSWSQCSLQERSNVLTRIADAVEARMDEFARAESLDQGKPFVLAREMDIKRVILNFRYFAACILEETERAGAQGPGFLSYSLRKPVGVAGLISPWNLPLYLLSWKMAPALACGNTVVCKPSEMTSLTADLLADVLVSAKVPPGVVNIVYGLGSEVGDAIVKHPGVPLISFTGGTITGKKILEGAAANYKKVSVELGGKNPNVIFADCDLDRAVATSLRSSFLNQGEICLCGSRILVEEKIYDQFVQKFVAATKALVVGDPDDPKTFMGALISKEHLAKVQSYIELAKAEGGHVLAGEEPLTLASKFANGYWMRPTILAGLGPQSRCHQEEIFGPLVTVQKFKSEEEALALANSVEYGLAGSVWTSDLSRAHRMAARMQVGTLWINTWLERDLRMPFGGMKHSGIGREGGPYSMDFYSESTTVCLRYDI